MAECLSRNIGDGEMGEWKLGDPEARGPGCLLPGTDPLTEERELESVVFAPLVGKGSRGIPPLGLELTMRSMIAGKLIVPPLFRDTPCRGVGLLDGFQTAGREQC